MAIGYSVVVDWNDNGTFTALTDDVLALWWRLGFAQAYDSRASPPEARITVTNRAGSYSPASSGLRPGHRLRIISHDGSSERLHFTGFVHHIAPEPGQWSEQRALIVAYGADAELSQNTVMLEPLISVRADQAIGAVLAACTLRQPVTSGYFIVGRAGHNRIGLHKLFGQALPQQFEPGLSTLDYVGDTWGDGVSAADAITQIAAAERGRFYVDRAGAAVFINRHHTLTRLVNSASFSDDMSGMTYSHGQAIANRVQVRLRLRSIGQPYTTLWTLSSSQRVPARGWLRINAPYRDASGQPIGALSVSPPRPGIDIDISAPTPAHAARVIVALDRAGASSARLAIYNDNDVAVTVQALRLVGTPLVQRSVVLTQDQPASITDHGLRVLSLALDALASTEAGDQVARYEVGRRAAASGMASQITTSTRTHPQAALTLTLFDRVQISESQTGHSADAFIISEQHQVDRGGARHQVTWTLEPADSDRFFIVGHSRLDGSHVLMY